MDRDRRLELQTLLEEILGSTNVYFQPPESLRINYPCIIYSREGGESSYADNYLYKFKMRYQVLYIDRNPDASIQERIRGLKYCRFDRQYAKNNLHHDSFTLFF
jgi:hypothetical protein